MHLWNRLQQTRVTMRGTTHELTCGKHVNCNCKLNESVVNLFSLTFSHLCNFIVIEKKQEVHREVRSEVYIFIYRNERDAKFYLLRGP